MRLLLTAAGLVLLAEGMAAFIKELPSISSGLPASMTGSSLLIALVFIAGLLLLGHGLMSDRGLKEPMGVVGH